MNAFKAGYQANGSAGERPVGELQNLERKPYRFAGKPRNWPRPEADRRLNQPPPRGAQTMLQIREQVWVEHTCADLMRAFDGMLRENHGYQPPSSLWSQCRAFWPKETRRTIGSAADQFEITIIDHSICLHQPMPLCSGETSLAPWKNENMARGICAFYALANGNVQ